MDRHLRNALYSTKSPSWPHSIQLVTEAKLVNMKKYIEVGPSKIKVPFEEIPEKNCTIKGPQYFKFTNEYLVLVQYHKPCWHFSVYTNKDHDPAGTLCMEKARRMMETV